MTKNSKRSMAAFIDLAATVRDDLLVAYLASHGFPARWDLTAAKALANRIGADVALAELTSIREKRIAAIKAERAAQLDAARAAWVAGDAHAFDGIHW